MVSILPGFTGVPVDNKTSSIDTPAYTTHSSPADSDGPFIDIADPPCQWILHSGIDNSRYVSVHPLACSLLVRLCVVFSLSSMTSNFTRIFVVVFVSYPRS